MTVGTALPLIADLQPLTTDQLPLPFQTLTQVAEQIRTRQLSSEELTKLMLKRIENIDGTWNSYATVMSESALSQSRQADREIASGKYRGPLHGVPIAVKDLCFTSGTRTMGGTAVMRDLIPQYDATVVTRLARAGSVLLGKLNLTEGAMAGYNSKLPVPVNPWNSARWPGCSSSGSGVAAAAGLAFGTLGSDTGGSIRYPSAACGIVGLKPTWGRVSRHGVLPLAESLDHVGPMARSVSDTAIILQAIAGHDPLDPTSRVETVDDYLQSLESSISGVRVGVDEHFISDQVDSEIAQGVLKAVDVLSRQGAALCKVRIPDISDHMEAWSTLCEAEAVHAHQAHFPKRRNEYGVWFRDWLDRGLKVSGTDYARAHLHRLASNGKINAAFHDVDVLVCPSMPLLPFPVTEASQYGRDSVAPLLESHFKFTVPFNYNGYPTLSLPCGFSSSGLPLSLQLVGKPLQESLLLQMGHRYEQVTEWHTRRPPMRG
jgi:amidase